MEAVSAVIGVMLAEPFKIVFGSIHARIKYFRKRESNFEALQDDTNILILIRGVVEKKLDQQEQMECVLQAQVEGWVKQVYKLEAQVKAMKSMVSTSDGNYDLRCSCSVFPMLCKLSNQLVKKMDEVKQLTDAGNSVSNKMSVPDKIIPVEHIPGPSITGQKTASENLIKLLDLLKNDEVTRIGVYGMGGVGKTTLIQNLNNKLEKEPSIHEFSMVIWVTVSKDTNLRKIQTRIAERLSLEVMNEESKETVASRLYGRLRKEKCFLLILDDVWEDIDLQNLGIPNPEECPRSKILITSRSVGVCRKMLTQAEFKVRVLNHKEACGLFQKHAGEVAVREDIRALAEVVANECAGLPLAITTVGASMRGKSDVRIWKNALRELQKSVPDLDGIEEKVFKTLKWSYDSIPSAITRSCFLFCCLYPEDYEIMVRELVLYWYCEGLLDECLNYEERENRGIAIIQNLRECCLLEGGRERDTVKVHDVVRDVGKWIASVEDECRSLVRSGIGLTCITENELLHSYKRVSFMDNKIDNLTGCVVQCPEASTLLLRGNYDMKIIPISFLQGFESLKILDLSRCMIESLPSLDGLNQLRSLILHECFCLRELPALDGLSRLLVLDCGGHTSITLLPVSLERLSSLRELDLSQNDIQTFPYVAISRLHELELLDLSLRTTPLEGQRIFEEVLPLLKHLTVFYAHLDCIPRLYSNYFNSLERIKKISLSVNERYLVVDFVVTEEYVYLRGDLPSIEWIEWSLRKAPVWKFYSSRGLAQTSKILAVNAGSCFASLKVLEIEDAALSWQADDTGASFDLLPNLEEIKFGLLRGLESVSDFGNILGLSFSRVRLINIHRCTELKCVLSLKHNQKLEKLQVMNADECHMLECLFEYPQDCMGLVRNLQEVSLKFLPCLESLCRNFTEPWKNLKRLEMIECRGIKKLPLEAQNAQAIHWVEAQWCRDVIEPIRVEYLSV